MYQKTKRILGPLIVIATLVLFGIYLKYHPAVVDRLASTSISTISTLLILYGFVQVALAIVLVGSLRMYGKSVGAQENFLLNAYSSLVNFFGPGQSGPGFRTLYLKVKHDVGIKQYILATLIYYAFYAVFSGIVLLSFARPWWVTAGAAIAIAVSCYIVIRYFMKKHGHQHIKKEYLTRAVILIAAATLLQIATMSALYYVELHSLDSSISVQQAVAYSGAANFAIFVALTPGAIGIREAFLFSSEKIHGVPQDIIVAANVLDRAVYIVFLGLLFLIVLSLHANKKLSIKKIKNSSE